MKKKQLNLEKLRISKSTLCTLNEETRNTIKGGMTGLATMCCLSAEMATCGNTCHPGCVAGTVIGTAASKVVNCAP